MSFDPPMVEGKQEGQPENCSVAVLWVGGARVHMASLGRVGWELLDPP